MTDDGVFGADVAATYDRLHGGVDPAPMAALLAELAGNGPALEFAIGTGRVALPLQAKDVPVHGIELSASMVDELRKKPGGADMDVTVGDMTTTRVGGAFSLVFLVFNTIDNLTSQDAQVACFENAARHLAPGGRFLVETLLPPLQKLPFGETTLAGDVSDTHMGIDEFDVATQAYASHHVYSDGGGSQRLTVPFRYAWPAEMDLMARIAGLELEYRWSDTAKTPFTKDSTAHVSVWKKA